MAKLKCLNENGVREFERYLIRAATDRSADPPYHLLDSPRSSAAFGPGEVEIEQRAFADRREFAEYIDARFVDAGIDEEVDVDGVREWLTLYYFDATCPVQGDRRRVKKPNRYVLNPSSEVDPRRALNRTVHWAFDQGMIWIDDDFKVAVTRETMKDERNKWLSAHHGRRLSLPSDPRLSPDRDALMWHARHVAEAA